MIYGIDIASHQGPNFNFKHVPNLGKPAFAVIKATGGHSYRNAYLAQQVQGARANDVEVGFYHYMFEPSLGGGDVRREVENFISTVRPFVKTGTTFWLDVEEWPESVGYTGSMAEWIIYFCERVQAEFGCICGIYCATWFLVPSGLSTDTRLTKYPLWFASWQSTPPASEHMAPWTQMTLWQYNADGVDKNRFDGTVADLRALGYNNAPVTPGNEIRTGILADGRPYVQVIFAGNTRRVDGAEVADLSIAVESATEPNLLLDQSVQAGRFVGWRERR